MKRVPRCVDEGKTSVVTHVSADDVCRKMQMNSGRIAHMRPLSNEHTVIFTPQGTAELYNVTGYGLRHPSNTLESQYSLYGYYFSDDDGNTTTVICHVLPLQSVRRAGSAAAVCADGDTSAWKALLEQEKFFKKYGNSNMDLIHNTPLNPLYAEYGPVKRVGFGHTHPGLHCFWSGTDRGSVFAAEGEPWVSLVVDPRNMEILAGVGPDLVKPLTLLYEYHDINCSSESRAVKRTVGRYSDPVRNGYYRLRSWYKLLFQSVVTGVISSFFMFLVLLGFRG